MKNFIKQAFDNVNKFQQSFHPKIQSSCEYIKQSVNNIFQTETATNITSKIDQNTVKPNYQPKINTQQKPNSLIPYSIEFQNIKYIVLSNTQNDEIYKVFPLQGWDFLEWENLAQIQTLFENHRRTFFKKVKSTPKFKRHVRNIFSNIWKKPAESQEKKSEIHIQNKLSPAERIKQKKQEKNKKKIQEKKQREQSEILLQKQKNQRENLTEDFKSVFWFSLHVSKMLAWNHKKISSLTPEQLKEKNLQINAASWVYKILLARLDNSVFQETKNIAPQKRFKILKSKIKKYLNQDFWNDPESANIQRHLHHLVNSSCDILVDSVSHKNQKSQWTDYYSQAA